MDYTINGRSTTEKEINDLIAQEYGSSQVSNGMSVWSGHDRMDPVEQMMPVGQMK